MHILDGTGRILILPVSRRGNHVYLTLDEKLRCTHVQARRSCLGRDMIDKVACRVQNNLDHLCKTANLGAVSSMKTPLLRVSQAHAFHPYVQVVYIKKISQQHS
jgi:hypothetical protein